MGISATGVLAYGFDLGGVDGEWNLKGAAEDDGWYPEWAPAGVDWSGYDYGHAIMDRLKAEGATGVEVVHYGRYDLGGFILATTEILASQGCTRLIAPVPDMLPEAWSELNLLKALRALAIEPLQERPAWILTQRLG